MFTQHLTHFKWVVFFLTGLSIASCQFEDEAPPEQSSFDDYIDGYFVVNQGSDLNETGSLSFVYYDDNIILNTIYQDKNQLALGKNPQSISVHNNKAYLVVGGDNEVKIADAISLIREAWISGFENPKYFLGISDTKGYVSQQGADGTNSSIAVVDLVSQSVSKTIPVGMGASRMVLADGKVFLCNSGGLDDNNTLSIINSSTDSKESDMILGYNPNSIVKDKNGKVWVLCGGKKVYDADGDIIPTESTPGSLHRINPSSMDIETTMEFADLENAPRSLCTNNPNQTLYYISGNYIYSQDADSDNLDEETVLLGNFYSIGIGPNSESVFVTKPGDFSSRGNIIQYSLSTGEVENQSTVGIGPIDFLFR